MPPGDGFRPTQLPAWFVDVVRWVQMWAPAIATLVVVGLAVFGVALVSAVDFFRRLIEARRGVQPIPSHADEET